MTQTNHLAIVCAGLLAVAATASHAEAPSTATAKHAAAKAGVGKTASAKPGAAKTAVAVGAAAAATAAVVKGDPVRAEGAKTEVAKADIAVAEGVKAEPAKAEAVKADVPKIDTASTAALSPDDLITRLSDEMLAAVKADKSLQAGDTKKIMAVVNERVMPHVHFQRMTSSAVGRYWRQATPEQQARLEAEFKTLLMRTYAGSLSQVKDQTVKVKPSRTAPEGNEVIVRSEVRGKGDPVQLDYRMEKLDTGWKIYDVNVLGVWLVENYRNSFAQEITANGIDGLIAKLTERNKTAGMKSAAAK